MQKVFLFLLTLYLCQSCSISVGENFTDKNEVNKFEYNNFKFTKINKKSVYEFKDEKLYIVRFYKYDCDYHNELLQTTFNSYNEVKENYKLLIVFVDRASSLKSQLQYLERFSKEKELYFLDFSEYKKGNLHKKFDDFLLDIGGDNCLVKGNENFVIKYDTVLKKCL